jgi:hypothetical protein
MGINNRLLSFDKMDRIENDASNNSSLFAAGICLPSRCLAPKGGIYLTEPLPCRGRRDIHTDTNTDGRGLSSTPLILAQLP